MTFSAALTICNQLPLLSTKFHFSTSLLSFLQFPLYIGHFYDAQKKYYLFSFFFLIETHSTAVEMGTEFLAPYTQEATLEVFFISYSSCHRVREVLHLYKG